MQKIPRASMWVTLSLLLWIGQPHDGFGQHQHHDHHAGAAQKESAGAPIRITMEELHEMGGVPHGWTFTLPPGDPAKGRETFVRLGCYVCHTVRGETFPLKAGQAGPDLTGAGAHHPAAYLAESIIHPNRVIVIGEGYTGPDGLSTMPNYNTHLTVAELIDLVAYITSLQEHTQHEKPHPTGHDHHH